MKTPGIELIEVSKSFAPEGRRVVDGVSLTVGRGDICALIGPNCSGKTTLLKLAAGLLRPTAGRVMLCGISTAEEPLKVKRILGFAAAEPPFCERMTAGRYLAFIARAFSLGRRETEERIEALADEFGFQEILAAPIGECPPGVRRKLALAAVFIHEPHALILDEPWADLDAFAVTLLVRKLKEAAGRGAAILFSTSFLEIARRTANRLAVIQRGALAAYGSYAALRKQTGMKGASLESMMMERAP